MNSEKSNPDQPPATLAGTLARMALEPATDALPASAQAATTRLLLDAIGCAVGGTGAPGVKAAVDQMEAWGGSPEATIFFSKKKVPAPHAAFANSTLIHALDFDDVYIPAAALHVTSVIVPTALAAGEMAEASGKDVLAAIALGIEVAGRLGIAARKRRRCEGFLPTTLDGGFGAVAAAARLLGMDEQACVHAMGLNYSQTAGSRQALLDSTLTKRMQPGFAARSALWAVALARRGVSGPPNCLEGDAGYFKTYLDGTVPDAAELTAPKSFMEVENTALKRYPSCGAAHPSQEAAERLAIEENLQPEEIARVELFGAYLKGGIVGRPFRIGENPQVDAQFSAAYAVALGLLRRSASLLDYTDEAVRTRTDLADLAASMSFIDTPSDVPDPMMDAPPDYPEYTTRPYGVVVHTLDGRRLVRASCPARTFAPDAATPDDVKKKLHDCARFSGVCSTKSAEALIRTTLALAQSESLDDLMSSLRGIAG
jgi:2-methylcitrate dehydratase PrpD